ncbi:MAG TPA: PQQ-dependent sugar dehydrogenase [Solirubrobacterales bacterium]
MGAKAGVATACVLAAGLFALSPAAAAQAPPDEHFEKVTLNDRPGEPMDLAVLPDGRVLHTTRAGQVWLHDPKTGVNSLAAELDVYTHDEEGLQSIALDPKFKANKWVYLYYSPPLDTPVDDPITPVNEGDSPETGEPADWEPYEGVIRLSRFKWRKDEIDLRSEEQILDVPVDRGICCHVGGDIVFDKEGNLYLATGDDTNPFQSDGYAPIDERPNRNPAFDAQRSAANTNDLRGKILRIKPKPKGGGYTIPKGNLFPKGTPKARPEIYAMGLRNPFRIEVDHERGVLYVADYSPDAGQPNPARGPAGHGKWFVLDEPGNYGWPYCATPDLPYVDYDFATGESGEEFDCANPVNESPHNTGRRELPPVKQPQVWYSYGASAEFPELGTGGIAPMAGPAYDYDKRAATGRNSVAWPRYYDGKPLFYEWARDRIWALELGADFAVESIEDVLGELGPARGDDATLDNGMDMEFGPDGALYVLEYGDGYFSENPDAQLARIDYIGPNGNHAPQVQVAADPESGLEAPLEVQFSSAGTIDPDGDSLRYRWDLNGDGKLDSTKPSPTFTYTREGVYRATLNVIDSHGRSAAEYVDIVVGNQPPEVEFVAPEDGDEFQFGDAIDFEVSITDEAEVDCSQVQVHYIVGHDTHGHPQTTASGCTGTIQTQPIEGHDPAEGNITGVFVAEYTDPGGLTGSAQVVLRATG